MASGDFLDGDVRALEARHITEDTCRKYGYRVGVNLAGKTVQIAEYRTQDGVLIAQKTRTADKKFTVLGEGKKLPLFGQHLFDGSGRRVTVTEGEIDALSVSQAFGNKWPAVSVPQGAAGAAQSVARALEWLAGFEEVVFCFDQDEPGRAAAVECAALLPPGKAKIAELPLKDANELVVAGKSDELRSAIYNARTYRPDGIVSLRDIRDRVLADVDMGRPYKDSRLNDWTYGRRIGELIGFGGGTGCGKTDWFCEQVEFDVNVLGITTGVLFLEQSVGETGRRLAGKGAGRRYHIPGDGWTQEELEASWSALEATGKLHLFDSFGACDWTTIQARISYMAAALGCEHIYLDHLTALAAAEDDERKALERIMAEMAGLAKRLDLVIHFVSHLTTPEGKPHEEGGRVMAKHFKGSRAIQYWSHFMFGLERDTQAEDTAVRCVSTLRCLKDRNTGRALGRTWCYGYDDKHGLLVPQEPLPKAGEASGHGFGDETGNGDF